MNNLKIAIGFLVIILVGAIVAFGPFTQGSQAHAENSSLHDPVELMVKDTVYDETAYGVEQSVDDFNKLQLDDAAEQTGVIDLVAEEDSMVYEDLEISYPSESGFVETRSYVSVSDFKYIGVIYGDDGTRYTWYSQNVLPGGGLTELNNNGRHVGKDNLIYDGDGYIAVASSDYAKGTIVKTPFGFGKVYDCGCDSGTIDIYTNF